MVVRASFTPSSLTPLALNNRRWLRFRIGLDVMKRIEPRFLGRYTDKAVTDSNIRVYARRICRVQTVLRIIAVLDFVPRPEFQIRGITIFRKLDLLPSSGKWTGIPVSETSSCLIFRIPDDGQSP
jgi:hypothetical protein